ncbi:hypothetical protein Hamer_G003037 [Homarus americanus]|uniref:Uncharacterized protein n=2 Tax=Homarus americanus TaxID=6706 RepID=A0A8J5TKL0_HOMAM|nr:hypothetical protein Hamer_G003037 [Homarus americanus]
MCCKNERMEQSLPTYPIQSVQDQANAPSCPSNQRSYSVTQPPYPSPHSHYSASASPAAPLRLNLQELGASELLLTLTRENRVENPTEREHSPSTVNRPNPERNLAQSPTYNSSHNISDGGAMASWQPSSDSPPSYDEAMAAQHRGPHLV